jgi:hypothetical protein
MTTKLTQGDNDMISKRLGKCSNAAVVAGKLQEEMGSGRS